jgi:YHS domain-containing protein
MKKRTALAVLVLTLTLAFAAHVLLAQTQDSEKKNVKAKTEECGKKASGCCAEKADKTCCKAGEQTACPVTGEAVNKEVFTEYKDQKVYFCCASCKTAFEKDPEKYAAKLKTCGEDCSKDCCKGGNMEGCKSDTKEGCKGSDCKKEKTG